MAETVEQDLFRRNLVRVDLRERVRNPAVMHGPLAVHDVRIAGRLIETRSLAELSAAAVKAPTTRLWPYLLQVAPDTRRTVVSPRLVGPAAIVEIITNTNAWPQPGLVGAHGLGLWYAEDGGDGGLGTRAAPPSGTPLFFPVSETNPPNSEQGATVWPVEVTTTAGDWFVARLGTLVPFPNWFLKLSFANASGVTTAFVYGFVRIVEGIDPTEVGF